jgi:hypothetical protein
MIKDNILRIKERIALVCAKINQDPRAISIVAVAKGRAKAEIEEVIAAGLTDIGENRVQEALAKYGEMPDAKRIKWHLVGHLQTNKVKDALAIFDLIHSVDSLRLAAEIDKQAAKINKVQDILIEVNTSGEASKFGLKPEEAIEVIKEMAQLKNINIKGLMTIAPVVDAPEKSRPYFRILRELKDKINELRVTSYELRVLSMGMTDDFLAAIEEGANIIRLGRAIFDYQV